MVRVRSIVALLIAVGVAVGAPATACAAKAGGLLLSADDVPGLHATGKGPKVARAALGVRKAPARLLRATAGGASFAGAGRRLRIGVFVLGSRARAAAALRSTGRGFRRLGGVGDAARLRTRDTRRSTDAVVLLRTGATLAAVRFTAPRGTGAATAARSYAIALAARVEREGSHTAWERALDGIRADGSITPACGASRVLHRLRPAAGREARAGGPGRPAVGDAGDATGGARLAAAERRAT